MFGAMGVLGVSTRRCSDLCISSPCFLQTYVFVLHFIVFEFLVRCPILTSVYHTVLSSSVPSLLTVFKRPHYLTCE